MAKGAVISQTSPLSNSRWKSGAGFWLSFLTEGVVVRVRVMSRL